MEPATHAPTPMPHVRTPIENWDIVGDAFGMRDALKLVAEEEEGRVRRSVGYMRREQYDRVWGPYNRSVDACRRLLDQMDREQRAPVVVEA
jgi:hypothetical protein